MQNFLNNWHFMRFLRLGIGIYIAIKAVETNSIFSGVVALLFMYQAFTNTGCCGTNGCAVPIKKPNSNETKTVEFEEIK